MLYIGIDTGKNTGFAVWNAQTREFEKVETLLIHWAMREVLTYQNLYNGKIKVRFEDARKRVWFGRDKGAAQLQGAGSIKRDCTIWEDFLSDNYIDFEAVAPKNNITKLSAEMFKKLTHWQGRTSEHARDAAMLVFGK